MSAQMDKPTGIRYSTADWAEQQRLCYQLRLEHWSIRQIAAMTGLSVGTVHKRIQDEIAETITPYREQVRTLEVQRLDDMSRLVAGLLERKHYVYSDGRVVHLDGTAVEDDEFVLKVVDRLLRIQERRTKYLGLDAATQVEVTEVTQQDIELRGLIQEQKARNDAQRAAMTEEAP